MANGAWREAKYSGGYEYDALTKGGRRVHRFKAGVVKYTQARFWRRVRRKTKLKIKYELGYLWGTYWTN